MRAALICLALCGCAHVAPGTDFTRAVDAAVNQSVDQYLREGTCLARMAVECRESNVLITFEREALYFDRSGKRVGRSFGPHLQPRIEGETPKCANVVREELLCPRAQMRVRRVGVTVRVSIGAESSTLEIRTGHQVDLGEVKAVIGFGDSGPVVLSLRRVPEGVQVLAGSPTPMKEVYERAVIELPARVTTVVDDEWHEFSVEIVRESYEPKVENTVFPVAATK